MPMDENKHELSSGTMRWTSKPDGVDTCSGSSVDIGSDRVEVGTGWLLSSALLLFLLVLMAGLLLFCVGVGAGFGVCLSSAVFGAGLGFAGATSFDWGGVGLGVCAAAGIGAEMVAVGVTFCV